MPNVKRLTPAKLALILVLLAALAWYASQVLEPRVPVTVQFESRFPGNGFVLIFRNDSDDALALTAGLEHPGESHEEYFQMRLQPHGRYSLGSAQGWVGASGDRITLTSPHHRVWRGAIP